MSKTAVYNLGIPTKIEYELHVNYGQGWEHELTEDTNKEAIQRQKEYSENCPQYQTKIIKRRVKS